MTSSVATAVEVPPRQAICRSPDESTACRFAGQCDEARQRVMHYSSPPIRGQMCWKFQQLTARLGSEAQVERAALQHEGQA